MSSAPSLPLAAHLAALRRGRRIDPALTWTPTSAVKRPLTPDETMLYMRLCQRLRGGGHIRLVRHLLAVRQICQGPDRVTRQLDTRSPTWSPDRGRGGRTTGAGTAQAEGWRASPCRAGVCGRRPRRALPRRRRPPRWARTTPSALVIISPADRPVSSAPGDRRYALGVGHRELLLGGGL